MGTSTSSSGAPSGVPLVPPWVPEIPLGDLDTDDDPGPQPDQEVSEPSAQVALAPRGRFGPARGSLGRFGSSGSRAEMRRGVGHYVAKGLGGTGTATRRFARTAQTAGTLYRTLSPSGPPTEVAARLDLTMLAGRTAEQIIDAVIEGIRPVDGTQDAESGRRAIGDALADLLTRYPDADLLSLSHEERLFAVERYLCWDIYARFALDVGEAIKDKAPTATDALERFKEARDYIGEVVAASIRNLDASRRDLTASQVNRLAQQALAETLSVFEEYVR